MNFDEFFKQAFGKQDDPQFAPFEYQRCLGEEPWPDLLDVPTGLGKTAAVSLAWLWKRGWRSGGRELEPDKNTPRRLIWCLPMRVLVEQTAETLRQWLDNLGILGEAGQGRVSIHLLMGGESDLKTWANHPDEDMILIGTQDMLLSRALMRGYGMSRYQWPVHFALLHNDCLWAFDEIQLMGVGLTTSAQLEAFRRIFPLGKASRSLWLSATLNPDWLATVDLAPQLAAFTKLELSDTDRVQADDRLNAKKILQAARFTIPAGKKTDTEAYLKKLCDAVLAAHDSGAQTLVILNRVDRAQGLFRLLRTCRPQATDLLIHARFRPAERRVAEAQLREASGVDRIIVATQAVEAGLDLSSKVLFTELAPWASMVQRFGRCNRYGEHNTVGGAQVFWIDIADDASPGDLKPYDKDALVIARNRLKILTSVGPADLPPSDEPRPLTPVLRRKDLMDLFNTDPDLSGFDVDVSDYIRDSGQPGLQIFWRDLVDPNDPEPQPAAQRDELCPISIGQAKALGKRKAWRWNGLSGRWERLNGAIRPGMTLLLTAKEGGYDPQLGFRADAKGPVAPIGPPAPVSQERYDADWRSSASQAVTLPDHLGHVADKASALCLALNENDHQDAVVRAGHWHDVGKAHAVFQQSMHRCDSAPPGNLAKSNCSGPMRHARPFFRHELASALAWLAQHDRTDVADATTDLVAYLIAANHGKVRMSLRAMPNEKPDPEAPETRFARGIWEGDVLPALDFNGEHSAETVLKLALMELGIGEQGRSWTERVIGLLDAHGPFRLAWLETLVRIADWRASADEQKETVR